MKIKMGDSVKIISGGTMIKNKVGEVFRIIPKQKRVQIRGIDGMMKHVKKKHGDKDSKGEIVNKLKSIHISKLMFMSKVDSRPVRIGYKILENGSKQRLTLGKKIKSTAIETKKWNAV